MPRASQCLFRFLLALGFPGAAHASVVVDSISPFLVNPVLSEVNVDAPDSIVVFSQSIQSDSNSNLGTDAATYPLSGMSIPTPRFLRALETQSARSTLVGFSELGSGAWIAGSLSTNQRGQANSSVTAAGLLGWGRESNEVMYDVSIGEYRSRNDQGSDINADTLGVEVRLQPLKPVVPYASFFRTRFSSDEALIDQSESDDLTLGVSHQLDPSWRVGAGAKHQRYSATTGFSSFDMRALFAELNWSGASSIDVLATLDSRRLSYDDAIMLPGLPQEYQNRDRVQMGIRITKALGIGSIGMEWLKDGFSSSYSLGPADRRQSVLSYTLPLYAD